MKEFQLLTTEETEQLLKRAQSGEEEAKQKLLDGNYPLIKGMVKKFLNKGVDYDDLYQLGCVGFLKAINNFSLSFGVKFSTYAVPMIVGEIKRFLRDDGEIKISRSIKTLAMKLNRYLDEKRKLGEDSPTIKELSEKFEVEEEDVVCALDSSFCLVSIYEKTADKSEQSPNLIDRLAKIEDNDTQLEKIMLKDLINALPEREKKIIILRYFRGKTQTEIAKMMNVSQVQISRIEGKILDGFRVRMS